MATVRTTRYTELGYSEVVRGCWRIFDITDGIAHARTVGPIYRTKMELLADLARYAAEFGCTPA